MGNSFAKQQKLYEKIISETGPQIKRQRSKKRKPIQGKPRGIAMPIEDVLVALGATPTAKNKAIFKKIESGEIEISFSDFCRICGALNCEPIEVLLEAKIHYENRIALENQIALAGKGVMAQKED